ncbi:MAG TPA: glycosyltransferase [Gemmatimonadales bacterium]|nr:glycosyltransferase [Gemmatimonadales bacterium]
MTAPFAGLRLLYVAPIDDADLAHNALRRRALERLGTQLVHLDPERAGWLERLVRRDLEHRLRSTLEQHMPDVVLVAGHGVVPGEVVDQVRPGFKARWVQLLGEQVTDLNAATREAMAYDQVFVGGSGIVKAFDREGVKHTDFLAVGCDPSVHKPLSARGPFRANVVFAGAATARRERLLSELVEFGLALWGPGWRKTSLRDYCRGELPNTEDFVRAYAGATVGVNIHRFEADDPTGSGTAVNRRLFEMAAIGVTQVVDARADLPMHFDEGSEVLTFTTAEQLKGQVKRAIQEDQYRQRLATNSRQRTLRQHTYMHRMSALLGAVTGTPAGA